MFDCFFCMCVGLSSSDSLTSIAFSLDVLAYSPGLYNIIVNVTDVYGQTATMGVGLFLSGTFLLMLAIMSKLLQITHSHFHTPCTIVPSIFGNCVLSGLNVYCTTSADNTMVTVVYNCSYDGGPQESCNANLLYYFDDQTV